MRQRSKYELLEAIRKKKSRGSSTTMPGFLVLILIKVLTQAQQLNLNVSLFDETIPNSVARIGSFWQL